MHHGNGTQGIFYRRADVLTVSMHADAHNTTPFFVGHAHETGEGDGWATTSTARCRWAPAMPAIWRRCAACSWTSAPTRPARWWWRWAWTPTSAIRKGLAVTTEGFGLILAEVARLGLPTVLVQEGGYLSDDLGPNLASALRGFDSAA